MIRLGWLLYGIVFSFLVSTLYVADLQFTLMSSALILAVFALLGNLDQDNDSSMI